MEPKANMPDLPNSSEETSTPSLKDQLQQLSQENKTLREKIERLEEETADRHSDWIGMRKEIQELKEEKKKWEDKAERWEEKAEEWEDKADKWLGDSERWKGEADRWRAEADRWNREFTVIKTLAQGRAFPMRANRAEVESEELKASSPGPRFMPRGPPDDRARREVRFEDPFYY
jgi:uncharacterized coiled-coil DUF342 family protein